MRDEDRVRELRIVRVQNPYPGLHQVSARRGGAEEENRDVAVERPEVHLHAAQRRQHLLLADVEPKGAKPFGERPRRYVAAVREERQRTARRADPLQHLDRSRLDVHGLVRTMHERPVDVEDEGPRVVKSHGATPRGRPPCARSGT